MPTSVGSLKTQESFRKTSTYALLGRFPGGSDGKESACSAGDPGLIPGSGRSPGEGNSHPLYYPCLENSMDRGAWQATAHGVAKSQTRLSDFTSALLTMPKPLFVWITTNWKILKEMGIPDHLTCLLRYLYAGQEATVRTGHGTTDWFQIGKGVCQGCIWSPCLFNFYAEYIMRNSGLYESQAGIKIARRSINNFTCADDTTLMAESEEEFKSLLMKVKE